ncbi:MAG: HAMP domain-containing sensor histidine kinase [Clostridiales bacterium]|nr:HAMP domain-containing sensor histidine kinase [Clostridiales bacterium]
MIQRLRKKMIITFMSIITVFLIVLTAMITLIPINHIETNKKKTIKAVISKYTSYSFKAGHNIKISFDDLGLDPIADNLLVIVLNKENELNHWISNRKDLYLEEDIHNLVNQLQKEEQYSGTVDGYFYVRRRFLQGQYIYGLIDTSSFYDAMLNALVFIIIFAVISWYICLCITIVCVEKMLKPVKESFQKQKQFISDAGHELKTPVAVIIANANVLEREAGSTKWLDYITNEAHVMQQLIKSLMSLAELEDTDKVLEFEEFDFEHVLMGATLPYESLAFEKGTVMEWEVSKNILFYGNKEKIAQMISALVNNAVAYCNENGFIKIGLKQKKRELELTVYNTGVGIPVQDREKVFQRFYRGDASRNRDHGNYGLGLPIVQSIIKEHHGRIKVSGTYGEDVCFTVYLPFHNMHR